ncbi:MAG: signal peptidase I [Aerococcaceae bacterium]|nr:signal peptidase I [Aerococcaceae bacterium]
MFRNLKSWISNLLFLVVVALLAWGVKLFVLDSVTISGASMDYELADGQRLFQLKLASVERFDIVIFESPTGELDKNGKIKLYIKRIIGVPGDTIEFKDDVLYLNGVATQEPYLSKKQQEVEQKPFTHDFTLEQVAGVTTVPEGKLFVMGDNRSNSVDSEEFGFVEQSAVTKVDIRFFPFDKMGILPNYQLNDKGQIVIK